MGREHSTRSRPESSTGDPGSVVDRLNSTDEESLATLREQMLGDAALGALQAAAHYVELYPHLGEIIHDLYGEIDTEADAARQLTMTPNGDASEVTFEVDPLALIEVVPEGDQLGSIRGYQLIREIARGGQGVVYLARDAKLGRFVAVKVLLSQFGESNRARQRFEREARVLAELDHPNLCTIYEMGVDGGRSFVAMKLVEGHPLSEIIRRNRQRGDGGTSESRPRSATGIGNDLPSRRSRTRSSSGASSRATARSRSLAGDDHKILEMVEVCARTLHEAHEARIVHRDIKPGNIMITDHGEPVILDFGLVMLPEEDGPGLTRSGEVVGTPSYMAPEQIEARSGSVDRRTDVYALGVTLFECLTLRRPYIGPTFEALCHAILNSPAPDPRETRRDLADDLATVVKTAMAKDMNRRYATAEALADDLQRIREGRPIVARPPSWWQQLAMWAERNRGVAALTALIIVVTTLGVGWLVYSLGAISRINDDLVTSQSEKDQYLDQFTRLAVLDEAEEILGLRAELWPREAGRRPEIRELRRRLQTTIGELDWVRPEFAELLARAAPLDAEGVTLDERAREERFQELYSEIETLEANKVNLARVGADLQRLERKRELLNAEEAGYLDLKEASFATAWSRTEQALAARRADPRLGRRMNYSFASGDLERDREDRWRANQLNELELTLARLEEFLAQSSAAIEEIEAQDPDETAAWQAFQADIVLDPRFAGLDPSPRRELVPLGKDAESGLWEFMVRHSGSRPAVENAGGALPEDFGVILVLLPGGKASLGSQKKNAGAVNFDPDRGKDEKLRVIEAAPFLMAKYETTQAQFLRVMERNPSLYAFDRAVSLQNRTEFTLKHPVEQVSWLDALECARRLGLRLPTESEWEYAVRGGTTSPWFFGTDVAQIGDFGNLFDVTLYQEEKGSHAAPPGFSDNYATHGPVDAFRPNPFGLHGLIGNVWEFCSDIYGSELPAPEALEQPRPRDRRWRVTRGGSFRSEPHQARSANRGNIDPEFKGVELGFRLARNW